MSKLHPNRVELGSMTTTQRDALSSPAAGTVIYNSTTNVAQVWNGAAWRDMSSGGIEGASGGTATPAPGGKVIRSFTSSGNFFHIHLQLVKQLMLLSSVVAVEEETVVAVEVEEVE